MLPSTSSSTSKGVPTERLVREWELEQADALQRARSGLLNFTCYTNPRYEVSWHHRLICRELNAFARRETRNLIITAPPRHGKSELVSRRLPAWLLGLNPDMELISASYSAALAKRMNRDVQRIMMDQRYHELFPDTRLNERNVVTDAQGNWVRNSEMFEVVGRRGYYLCAGVGGPLTGSGGDAAIIDDPIKSWQDAYSKAFRERTWEWYTSVLDTRLSRDAGVLLTLTRWHEDDLAGRIIAKMKSDPSAMRFKVINLPALNEDGPSENDPRQEGEALWPERFPLQRLQQRRANSTRMFVSLYQGRPAPPDGDIVKRAWFRYYRQVECPSDFDFRLVSIDGTFKDKEKNDFFVMQLWGAVGAKRYLLRQVRGRMGYTRQKKAIQQMHEDEGDTLKEIAIEDSANGAALVDDLQDTIPGIIAVPVGQASKLARLESVAGIIEANQVYLPHPDECDWVEPYVIEMCTFPNDKNDDQVDATSLGLARMRLGGHNDDWAPLSLKKASSFL